jgi:mycothiol synthase
MILQTKEVAPMTEAFAYRAPTMDDVPAIVDLLNFCAIDQIGRPDINRSELLAEWNAPGFDRSKSIRIAETGDGVIIGYIEVWDTDPLPVKNWVWGRVHPAFEGLGIGTDLMFWAEDRLQETLYRVPDDLRVTFRAGSLSTHVPTKNLMEKLGMTLSRYFWRMMIDLQNQTPLPVWPKGISLETFGEVNDIRTVYLAFDDAFRDHWGYVQQPEAAGVAKWEHWISSDEAFEPSLWFMAMDGDEIAGICLCRKKEYEDPDMGWVSILGVRRPWRKQGLGLALLHHAFRRFRQLGKLRAGLGVDAHSLTGAPRLYEKAGMHVMREIHTYEKELRSGREISKQEL